MIEITEKIKEEVEKRAIPLKIKKVAQKEGMHTLRESALRKLFAGATTFDEIIRVTGIAE